MGCPRFKAIKGNERAQAHSDRCRLRIEECLRATPQGTVTWGRRSDVINVALAEIKGHDQQKRTDVAEVHQQHHLHKTSVRETPIELDPNPREDWS